MSDGGKGDNPRPYSVSMQDFDRNMTTIYGNKPIKDNSEYFAKLKIETEARIKAFDSKEDYDIDPENPDK